ncbi:MAG: TrkA C-terminal domain-containing protein [Flavonifractor plautii]
MNALYKHRGWRPPRPWSLPSTATTRHLGTPLRDLPLKPGILVAVIVHQGREIIIPEGSSSIQEGDTVILISRRHGVFRISTTSMIEERAHLLCPGGHVMNLKLVSRLVGRRPAGRGMLCCSLPLAVALLYQEDPAPSS